MRILGLIVALTLAGNTAAPADETEIPLDKVPKPVAEAFEKKFPEATLKAAIREEEGGKVSYELESTLGGLTLDAVLTPPGEFMAIEREIKASDLPAPAVAAAKARYAKGKITKAVKVDTKGKITFEAVVKKEDGKSATLLFDKDGKFIEEE